MSSTQTDPDRPRSARLRGRLPQILLALLLVLLTGFVVSQADAHGRSYDEPLQEEYGQRVLDWYRTGGSDDHFLDFPERQQMPQHGPLFETLVAGAQSTARGVSGHAAWAEPWHVRSVVTGLTGVVGIGLIGLCGVELGRAARRMRRAGGSDPAAERDDASAWWLGLVAAVGLALYPRYTGGMFNNSKDVPLAVAMVLVLWLTMRLARRWVERPERLPVLDAILVGVALGAAMSIRLNALVWYGILGCLALGWLALRWRRGRPDRLADLRRVVLTSALVAGTSYLSILAMWPYIFLNPVTGLPDAFASMSRYQWDNPILYGGEMVPAMHLPATYPLTWLWLGSPWLTVVLAVVGLGFVVADVARRRIDAAPLLVAAAFVLPLLALVVLRPTLYNGLRHFIFVVPPMVLLAAFGLVRALQVVRGAAPWRRIAIAAVVVVAVAAQVQVLVGVARLYPYEYMYFNAASGGFGEQHSRYETDYWGVCSREAARWLDEHRHEYTSDRRSTVRNKWAPTALIEPYVGPGLRPVGTAFRPDFGIYSLMNWRPDPWPDYLRIHDVTVEGVTICRVEQNPALS